MDKKDLLGMELKLIMEEETKDLSLSTNSIDKMLNFRKRTLQDKIKNLLNKEIEIPLAPAIVGLAALLAITTIPKDIFKSNEIRIIDIGSSQVIIREKEVSSRWK